MKILKGSTWENLCLRKTFRGGTFSGWKYFQPLKVHLAVCWRILKSGCAGLRVWRIVLRSLTENGLRSPGDKGREFFLSAHYGGSRQHPPMNDFEIREYFMDTLLRLIYSRTVIQLSVWISKWSGIWIAVQAIIKIATRIGRQISGRMDIWLYGYVGCRLNMHIAT